MVSNKIGTAVEWTLDIDTLSNEPRQVDLCESAVVMLIDQSIFIYDRNSVFINSFSVKASNISGIACGNNQVFVTGYRQVSANLQQPFLESYTNLGELNWKNWGWSAAEAISVNSTADSRGLRVRFSQDEHLYFAGSTDGGNNTFRFNPQDLNVLANTISFDEYNQPFGFSGSPRFSYYAKIDPINGNLIQGQFLLTRLTNGNGNSITIDSIAINQNGHMLAGGQAFASIDKRNDLTVNGTDVAPYAGADPYIINVSTDYMSRSAWHVFNFDAARGRINAVENWNGLNVFVAHIT
ncbi:MAG: hypothetical protein AB8B80_16980 [Marinicellaceae bacterium]